MGEGKNWQGLRFAWHCLTCRRNSTLGWTLFHFDWKLSHGIIPETLDMTEYVGRAIKRRIDIVLIPIPYTPLPIN